MKYAIEFKHIIELNYEAIVEAKNKEEASELFYEDPFLYINDPEPTNEQGLEIVIESIKEMN